MFFQVGKFIDYIFGEYMFFENVIRDVFYLEWLELVRDNLFMLIELLMFLIQIELCQLQLFIEKVIEELYIIEDVVLYIIEKQLFVIFLKVFGVDEGSLWYCEYKRVELFVGGLLELLVILGRKLQEEILLVIVNKLGVLRYEL